MPYQKTASSHYNITVDSPCVGSVEHTELSVTPATLFKL